VQDTLRTDYNLNTTTGNRPTRAPVGTVRTVTPQYIFSGNAPKAGDNYRVSLASQVTADFQFSRAAVNYIWKEFMGKAFVEPMNQLTRRGSIPTIRRRTLETAAQPAEVLNDLSQSFIDNGYDLKKLMRTIVLSEAYQLSSRYDGQWSPAWEDMYARHLPRRMWAEEVADAVVQSSGMPNPYNIATFGKVDWAMQLPDTANIPGGAMASWLDSFMRGNRDNEDRRTEGSTLQVLNLMNDSFVLGRSKAQGKGATSNMMRLALDNNATDQQTGEHALPQCAFAYPSDDEMQTALAALKSDRGRQKERTCCGPSITRSISSSVIKGAHHDRTRQIQPVHREQSASSQVHHRAPLLYTAGASSGAGRRLWRLHAGRQRVQPEHRVIARGNPTLLNKAKNIIFVCWKARRRTSTPSI